MNYDQFVTFAVKNGESRPMICDNCATAAQGLPGADCPGCGGNMIGVPPQYTVAHVRYPDGDSRFLLGVPDGDSVEWTVVNGDILAIEILWRVAPENYEKGWWQEIVLPAPAPHPVYGEDPIHKVKFEDFELMDSKSLDYWDHVVAMWHAAEQAVQDDNGDWWSPYHIQSWKDWKKGLPPPPPVLR